MVKKITELRKSKDQELTPQEREKLFNEIEGEPTNAAVNASFAGATALHKISGGNVDDADVWKLILTLDKQVKKVNSGDLKAIEGVLTAQIHILNNMFNRLAIRSLNQTHINFIDQFMRLAFKAQNQCRVTVETLVNLKNPPASTFVKQANIGYNQQVNNNPPATEAT